MRLERIPRPYSPEAGLFRAPELVGSSQAEARLFVPRTEVVLFSRTAKEDPKIPGQSLDTDQIAEPTVIKPNDDWEPFSGNTEPDQKFRNLYGGNYAQDMELNRKKVEQFISVSALQGVVALQSLPQTRGRGIDINPDGSTTSKKNLFWGEKPEDKENPYQKVTSTPEGWKIEICDQRIRDELSDGYSGDKLKKKFTEKFNQHLRAGILEAVVREKLSFSQDPFRQSVKTFSTISTPAFDLARLILYRDDLDSQAMSILIAVSIGTYFMFLNLGMNTLTVLVDKSSHDNKWQRNLTSFYESFMPLIEVDRVLRGLAFANIKGRNLVRLRPDETKTSAR